MPRLHQVPRSEARAEIVTVMYDMLFDDRDPVAEPGTATPRSRIGAPRTASPSWSVSSSRTPIAWSSTADERVVEVAAPEGYEARDIGRDISGPPDR